jgi:hypothetical protein
MIEESLVQPNERSVGPIRQADRESLVRLGHERSNGTFGGVIMWTWPFCLRCRLVSLTGPDSLHDECFDLDRRYQRAARF